MVGFRRTTDASVLGRVVAALRGKPLEPGDVAQLGLQPGEAMLLQECDDMARVAAVQLLAQRLRTIRGDVRGAAHLYRAVLDFVMAWPADHPARPSTLRTAATSFASLAVDGGMAPLVVREADHWISLLEALAQSDHDRSHLDDVRLRQVEALLHGGRYEEAREKLATVVNEGLREDLVMQRERLANKLGLLLSRPDERTEPINAEAVIAKTLAWLRTQPIGYALVSAINSGSDAPDAHPAERVLQAFPEFPSAPGSLSDLQMAVDALADAAAPLAAVQSSISAAGRELQAAGHCSDVLVSIRDIADHVARVADEMGYWEEATTAWWIACVALRRDGRHAQAVAALLALASRLEQRRQLVRDPRLRAGLAVFQPQLPWALTESALLAGDHEAALFGAEMSKSRILADLRADGVDVPASPRSLALGLSERLRGHPRVHLLSFLVDHGAPSEAVGEAGVLAVLRLADGRTFGAKIMLSAVTLEAAAQTIDHRVRRGHGRKLGDIYAAGVHSRPFDDVLTAMAPLVNWLEPLVLDTQLRAGDTLVYAADGALHNLPLGMLPFAGQSLIDYFALVAMPSLALGLTPGAAVRPRRALAVLAPDVDERAAGMTYESEVATLHSLLPTSVATDFASLLPPAADRLLHLCAHGEVVDGQPLTHGGLMLPAADGRYDRLDTTLWVSADKLAAAVAPGTHLTLRACLVGRAEQVTSREPLGAVWSVLAGAAASIVAASWTVDIGSAGRWCDHFYGGWLARGMSRAQAHRAACLALRGEGGEWTHPVHWAPFVLYAATLEGDIVMDDELRARVRALTDKQAVHYVNQLASSPETDRQQSDDQFLEAVHSELAQVTASALRLPAHGVVPTAQGGELARGLLLFLIDTGEEGRQLTEAALQLPQARTADFGTLTHAAVLIIGWLAVTGDIRVKLGSFEYRKQAMTPASQAKLAKDFLAAVGKLVGL